MKIIILLVSTIFIFLSCSKENIIEHDQIIEDSDISILKFENEYLIGIIENLENEIVKFEIGDSDYHIFLLKLKNDYLRSIIKKLEIEIDKFKQTDQYYFQSGVNEYKDMNYKYTIYWLNRLKNNFPDSLLLIDAEKIINNSIKELGYDPTDEVDYALWIIDRRLRWLE